MTLPKGLLKYARELKASTNWGIRHNRDERHWAMIIWLKKWDIENDTHFLDDYCRKYYKDWRKV